MLRKMLKGILVGAGLLAMTTTAQAVDINLYGASAQFLFWNDLADDFCVAQGCTDLGSATDSTGKHGVTACDCNGDGDAADAGDLVIRYSSKASYDGIYACKGEIPPSGQPSCASTGARYREMITSLTDTSLSCQEVTIGASDVDGSCFGQNSEGNALGHLGGSYISRSIPKIDTSSMDAHKSVVVPFGFFKNTEALPDLENLTQPMAGIIFSGTISSWGDFDGDIDASGNCLDEDGVNGCDRDDYPDKWVVACLRHAGSGTHATLADLLRCGYSLVEQQTDPVIWFNDGSSDMMRCIAQNGGMDTTCFGAIGYADCDQVTSGTTLIKYQGEECNKCNIKNGVYPFWSAQYLFLCDTSNTEALAMITYGQANVPSSKADFWNTYDEMRVDKGCGTAILPKATGNWGGACVDSSCQ